MVAHREPSTCGFVFPLKGWLLGIPLPYHFRKRQHVALYPRPSKVHGYGVHRTTKKKEPSLARGPNSSKMAHTSQASQQASVRGCAVGGRRSEGPTFLDAVYLSLTAANGGYGTKQVRHNRTWHEAAMTKHAAPAKTRHGTGGLAMDCLSGNASPGQAKVTQHYVQSVGQPGPIFSQRAGPADESHREAELGSEQKCLSASTAV